MKEETLILVDENDNFLGYASRDECHRGRGKRHRAFVTLLVDSQNRVILQKRKHRLFDNLWDLTAISHPLHLVGYDEDYQQASDRALKKEIGIGHGLVKKVGAFNYFAKDGQNCENEYCTILVGEYDGDYRANPNKVYETKKINFKEFIKEVSKNPKKYTPWTRLAVGQLEMSESIGSGDFQEELKAFLEVFEPYSQKYFSKKVEESSKYPILIKNFYKDLEDFGYGGKAMRPFLVYLAYRASGGKDVDKILPICLAFELIHHFFLIEDDIIDESDTRRGKLTIHKRFEKKFGYHYGISQAMMLADIAVFEAFGLVNEAQFDDKVKAQCWKKLINVLLETVYGEILDVEYSHLKSNIGQIWQMIDLKTARYTFVGPLTVGALFAGANKSQIDALGQYGLSVGAAFQLQDDILGVFGDEKVLGKPTLSDLREGKNTILIYRTREMASTAQKERIAKLWGKRNGDMRDLRMIREIIRDSGARQWSQSEQAKLIRKAKEQIPQIIADKNIQKILFQLADFVIAREK